MSAGLRGLACLRHLGVVSGSLVALAGGFHLALDPLAELLCRSGDFIELAHNLAHPFDRLVGHRQGVYQVPFQCANELAWKAEVQPSRNARTP